MTNATSTNQEFPPLSESKIGLVFGTDTGNTEEIGGKISELLGESGCSVEMLNVVDIEPSVLEGFDFLILGIPTWDFGGIQEDWENFEDQLATANLNNVTVALYGLGDQRGYGDFFLDAMGWLHERVEKIGARIIGAWPTEGYEFEESLAANDDKTMFCGLGIDEDQQFELTDERVSGWVAKIIEEYDQKGAA